MKTIRPFLKWAGNKYRCLHHILPLLAKSNRLIEPFTGSGAVFINSDCSSFLLAEANQDLVQLFRCLQKEGEAFITYCKSYFTDQYNNKGMYYQLREDFNNATIEDTRLKSALFLYLNRHGYNGLCRYNSKGQFNVPFGQHTKPYFPAKEMLHFYLKSQDARFIKSDFRDTFSLAQAGDLIYCDPPYVPLSASANFSAYTHHRFQEKEQIELAQLAKETAEKGITVVISNHDTAFTREHYQDAEIRSFLVPRFISCDIEKRNPVQELIAVFK